MLELTFALVLATSPSASPIGTMHSLLLAEADTPLVRLHLLSTDPDVEVRRVTARFMGTGWGYGGGGGPVFVSGALIERVCGAPCGVAVDPSQGRLFVGGPMLVPSSEFSLAGHHGDVTIRVEPGSFPLRVSGITSAVVGGMGMLGGTALALRANHNNGSPTLGWGLLGASTALVAAGIAMISGSSTSYQVEAGTPGAEVLTTQR